MIEDIIVTADADNTDANSAEGCHPLFHSTPSTTEFKKLRKRLLRHIREAIENYGMVTPAKSGGRPRWLIGLSGGKDSYGLLALLADLKWRGLLEVDLLVCNLDQGQPNFPKHILPNWLKAKGFEYRIEYQDTYSVVTDKLSQNSTYCSLCSRLRRGHLYRVAREEGCDALILGHHREDILETLFMNLFHGGRLATMAPKLLNDEGDIMVMRPLVFCSEDDMEKLAQAMEFPIIPCDLCGSQDGLQRNVMKQMISDIEKRMPGRKDSMIRALSNIRPSHLLDNRLFDFAALGLGSLPDLEGDDRSDSEMQNVSRQVEPAE
ncbi:MAG: tRNA 2-thiocytidine(32) synthetase TtcA [Hyphomicrobiales bacterium]|nr:tRNA 2-thiocytidine(32) synthetase TtcA [Hyphomicrobiales bacterium]